MRIAVEVNIGSKRDKGEEVVSYLKTLKEFSFLFDKDTLFDYYDGKMVLLFQKDTENVKNYNPRELLLLLNNENITYAQFAFVLLDDLRNKVLTTKWTKQESGEIYVGISYSLTDIHMVDKDLINIIDLKLKPELTLTTDVRDLVRFSIKPVQEDDKREEFPLNQFDFYCFPEYTPVVVGMLSKVFREVTDSDFNIMISCVNRDYYSYEQID